jgi:hypothetical protein
VGGLLIGAIAAYIFLVCRARRREPTGDYITSGIVPDFGRALSVGPSRYRPVPTSSGHYQDGTSGTSNTFIGLEYQIEPFRLPGEEPTTTDSHRAPTSPTTGPLSDPDSQSVSQTPQSTQQHQVYVVHHDGGRAPVTVYTPGGAEVVELPPTYAEGSRPRDDEQLYRRQTTRKKGSPSVGSRS